MEIFQIKKHLDNLTRGQGITKKIIFPKKSRNSVALAIVQWHEKLHSLYWLWENDNRIFQAELLTCKKQPDIKFATITFRYLAIKFKSPDEAGYGVNIYNLENIAAEQLNAPNIAKIETKTAP